MTIGSGNTLLDALKGCERGEWQHSPLYLWMAENFDIMEKSIGGGRVRWGRIAEAAHADGLMARHGGPAAPNTVKSTWYRVRKAVRRMLEMREEEVAATQARHEAARARRLQEGSESQKAAPARAEAERELAVRQIAERGFPPAPAAPSIAPVTASTAPELTHAASEATLQDEAPSVVIGQIKRPVKMLEAAPGGIEEPLVDAPGW